MVSDDGGKEVFWSILSPDITSLKIKQIFIECLWLEWITLSVMSPHLFQKRNNTFLKNNFYSGLVRHIRRLPAALSALTGMMNEWMNERMDGCKQAAELRQYFP